ncbi:hypothetical protein ElyMa_002517700 [Elysia marginata]|uniref:Reverse transcriptase domain-containing protein n=1 Tax=Elysia marginata TaxID=1093978 RepID=A0AAV4GUN9_9GAST|nr:hypothetical protein ElyMa_002517700 [Elysia marginata]
MNTTECSTECTKELSNTLYYKKLDSDPTVTYNNTIKRALQEGIDKREFDMKIGHALLQPHPTPAQDDIDFLRKVYQINNRGPLPPDTLLCTMDVSGLYTNIPHEEGLTACWTALEADRERGAESSSSFLCRLIHLILSLYFFTFSDNTYLQVHGTAMSTCMAPTYANIFMGAIETGLLYAFPDKPLVWLRYIDDIFLIWTHGRAKLEAFIAHANTFTPPLNSQAV